MKILLYFFASSVGSAILNYLFQAMLALKLGPTEFSQFTLNWSYLGMASIIGGFFQYWASLNSVQTQTERKLIFFSYLIAAALFTCFLVFDNTFLFVLTLAVVNISLSLKIGRAIGNGDYEKTNTLNLTFSISKILIFFLFFVFFKSFNSMKALYIVLAAFIFAEAVYSFLDYKSVGSAQDLPKTTAPNLVGPFLFSILLATLPQLDILWVNWFKNKDTLTLISELSFLSKGMFFFQVIAAQWVFSKQKKNTGLIAEDVVKYGLIILGLLILASILGSYLMPVVIMKFLSWPIVPSRTECFGASISAGLMSLFYQACQVKIIAKKNYQILASVLLIALIYLASGFSDQSLENYFLIVSSMYLIIVFSLFSQPLLKIFKSSSNPKHY